MGFFDDLIDGSRFVLRKTGQGAVKAADALVDQDAWKRTGSAVVRGDFDDVRLADLGSMALDASTVVPGVGLVGGASRIAGRQVVKSAMKNTAQEAAERAAKKKLAAELRSEANNKARDLIRTKVGDTRTALLGGGGSRTATRTKVRDLVELSKKGALKESKGTAATQGGKALASKGGVRGQVGRMAQKKEAGVGRRVGFGQSRKRIAANTAASLGLNALESSYNALLNRPNGPAREAPSNPGASRVPGYGGPMTIYGGSLFGGGGGGGYGGLSPQQLEEAIAAYYAQNGNVNGQYVIAQR